MNIPSHFRFSCSPVADPSAVRSGSNVRFTVLTSRLIRIEFGPADKFEDLPSQVFWHRRLPVPEFETIRDDEKIEIMTEHLHLIYRPGTQILAADLLSILLKESDVKWRFGDVDDNNLLGTARTLDMVSGGTQLEAGLISRSGWAVVDDTDTLLFNEHGWLEPRAKGGKDLYFFGYGDDYRQCLRDYCRVTGGVPLLPRWALGNWWSRYWPYAQNELIGLMEEFREHEVPLSVCIVDMDWHIVNTGRGDSGWTGYTWNRALFPDPPGFIGWLHDNGLKTALNLHPALGVRPHEEMYPEMARYLDIDPDSEKTVEFDIADPRFARAYFELLHHPQERDGVDFWWIDWQQGETSGFAGLDPLWWLNHLHFHDHGRDGDKRPFIFSRWGGLGNHRYPIGFSGDTVVNWESLAFQPYFTATAANVAYGWWSHDIGGHMWGIEEPELYARWVQFGVFSPIMRLHSTQNPFHERRPWGFDSEVFEVTREAMQLRQAMIPYLYSMSYRNVTEHEPLIRPTYHDYADHEEAYYCPQQYTFGSELIAAPFTSPADPETRLSRQVVWLPPGEWHDFFAGERYGGGKWYAVYGRLRDIPVFARSGAIVPLGPKVGWGGADNPAVLDVHVFAGASSKFTSYEDDGETTSYLRGEYFLTEMEQDWQENEMLLRLSPSGEADAAYLPSRRQYRFHVHGVKRPDEVSLQVGPSVREVAFSYDADAECVHVAGVEGPVSQRLTLRVTVDNQQLRSQRDRTLEKCRRMLRAFKMESSTKAAIADRLSALREDPSLLARFALNMRTTQLVALLEVTQQVGVHHVRETRHQDLLVLWNNQNKREARFQYTMLDENTWNPDQRFQAESGPVPHFRAIAPTLPWQLKVDYFGLTAVSHQYQEVKS
jgi:hypothetical protein